MTELLMISLVSEILFAKTYGGTQWEGRDLYGKRCLVQSTDGGYAIASMTGSFGAGGYDAIILKLSWAGDIEWARTLGGSGDDCALSMTKASDGGYAVAGYTKSFGSGMTDVLVAKVSGSGNLEWARTFGGADYDQAFSIIQDPGGDYMVVGFTSNFGAGGNDVLVLRLAATGDLVYARTFGGTEADDAQSIARTTDGGYVIAMRTWSFGAGGADAMVMKISPSGSLDWARTLGWGSSDDAMDITGTSDGGCAVAIRTVCVGAGSADFLLVKLSSGGAVEWAKTYGGTNYDWLYSVIQTQDGGYALAGTTSRVLMVNYDFLFMKLSASGDLEWARVWGGDTLEDGYGVIQTTDGGFAITGMTTSFGAGNYDFLLLKLGSDGIYTDCVEDWLPTVMDVSPTTTVPTAELVDWSPSSSVPGLTVTTPFLSVSDACMPLHTEESSAPGPGIGITCTPVPGAALFISPKPAAIKIYSADGRVTWSGRLQEGQNRIGLDQGVYFWSRGNTGTKDQSGKVTVR